MAPQSAPLDEAEFDQPWLLHDLPGGNINSDSILWYFMNSPFFDPASNNIALLQQLRNHPDGQSTLMSRRLFEEHLAKFPAGVSYFCVAEPQGPGQPYVIQRQFKMLNQETGRTEIQVQGTYYTNGTKIYMAPSLLDVVQLRLLTTATQLQQAYDLSKNLSQFAPGVGHSYLPPSYELPKTASTASRIGSPTLAAAEPAAPASQSQPQTQMQRAVESTETADAFSDALFLQSLKNTDEYYDEFMDENPLQGEPGAFVFRETYGAVKARERREEQARQRKAAKEAEAAAAASAAAAAATAATNVKTETQSTLNSGAVTPKTGVGATPAAQDPFSRKQSLANIPIGKAKRKKSKGLGTPVTPTAPQPNFPS
jgi:mediator of RNA polymerase II transcription subunit 6